MSAVIVIIKRQWYGLRRHLLSWFIFLVLLPIILYMVFGLSLYKVIANVNQLNYLHWAAPGIWVSSGFLMSYLTAFIAMHHLRQTSGLLTIYLKAPVSCWTWLTGQTVWSILIGSVQLIVSLLLIGIINGELYSVIKWATLLVLIFPSVVFGAVLGTFVGSWVRRLFSAMLVNMVIIIAFLSCSGSFIPLTYFPHSLQSMFMIVPIVMEISAVQHLILYSEVMFSGAVLTLVLSACLFILNGAMIQHWIRK
ncbi:MAG: ABC transporter permease [Candidatus Marinimicrobia bacterium]|nr:ABC transporter permease [Candidatus Neomarinimicrobiota bacterium]